MVIWKAKLQIRDRQNIEVPAGATILTSQIQKDELVLWYQCIENSAKVLRKIAIYGTGNPMPSNPGKYISTFQMKNGDLVFHVYELES